MWPYMGANMIKIVRINGQKFICYPLKNGEGKYAKCYLTEDSKTLKVYHPYLKDDEKYYEESLRPFEGIKNDTFAFPEQLFVEDGTVLGYIYKYIKGKTLANNKDINIELFTSMLSKIYSDIEEISKRKIFTSDMGPKNIIFNGKFNIIDTDNYFILDCLDAESCLNSNIAIFNQSILDYMLRNSKINNNLLSFIYTNFSRDMIYELTRQDNPSSALKKFIEELVYSLEKETNSKIKTFNDIHKSLVRR